MVISGGLRPIASRVALDLLALASLAFCTFSSAENASNSLMLVGTCFVTLATAGMTCRWTLTFPMVPIVILQSLRRLEVCSGPWTAFSITSLTAVFIFLAAILSFLFPAVQLPEVKGEYHVGMVKLHLPVNIKSVYDQSNRRDTLPDEFVSVRIYYPTKDEPRSLPYLDPDIALDYCKETIAFGAPPPLKQFGFLLHNLRLVQMPVALNAKPLDDKSKLPIVIYSHGLGGTSITYTYQTQHLAARGYVVLVLDHSDGSAPVAQRHDGTRRSYDASIVQMWKDGKEVEYVRERRARTDHRVREFIASAVSLLNLNERNIPQLDSVGVSFVNKLDTYELHFMGHSFGACTALTAASRRPDLVSSVVAHEPVVDWMPDDARRMLFPEHKLVGGPRQYDGGTGGFAVVQEYVDEKKEADGSTCQTGSSLHDVPMLFLYSDEWKRKGWGGVDLVQYMHQQGELGPNGSEFGVIQDAHHTEFSDTSMMTPLWLARSVGVTGKRNPRETAEEILNRTVGFLSNLK